VSSANGPHRQWDGATYDRVADPQTRWGATVLDRLHLDGSETVLDCGCGSGRVTERLVARLPTGRVIALDASRSMLDEARHRLAAARDRVTFVEGDLLDLTPATLGKDAPVDALFSTATFHLITDHDRLFANLASVVRGGGQLAAQCGAHGNIESVLAIARRLGLEGNRPREYASPEVTRARLEAAGFADVRVWISEEPTRFEKPEQLMDFLEAVCLREAVAGMADDERRALVRDVVEAMPEPVIDYVRLNIAAVRAQRRGPAGLLYSATA
jgi:trans-aconitate 2-methyltransferase